MMKKIGIVLLVGIMLSMYACEDQDAPAQCAANNGCTEVFITLVYEPKDISDAPIILDNYYSQNLDNGNTYTFTDPNNLRTDGVYQIITDAQIDEVNGNGTTVRFFGEKNGLVVLQQDFEIGHDCCHVKILEGPGAEN